MAARELPDIAYLRECLDYNPRTGAFRWRVRPVEHFVSEPLWQTWNTRRAGTLAGHTHVRGHRYIHLDSVQFKAHRLAWLLTRGRPVPVEIDHKDGDKGNNRISNLRAATRADNQANKGMERRNRTGVKGIYPNRDKYGVQIWRNKRRYYLGVFATIEEAAAVRREAADRLQGEFARHS